MAKVNYRTCDICGKVLNTDIRLRGYTNGYRMWNKIFNGLDICTDCMNKIRYLSIDKQHEDEYMKEFFNKKKKYDNSDMQEAYYTGLDDALQVLSHHRLNNIKKQ